MWLARRTALLGLVLVAGQIALATVIALPPIVKTMQRSFTIPFGLDPLDPAGAEPREVQLHVSEDRGKSWHVGATAQPDELQFNFRAPQDGEYWFIVKTVDAAGKLWPETNAKPELRVVVEPLRAVQAVVPGFPVDRMPADAQPRMVNSLSFEIDYDVEPADSPSGKDSLIAKGPNRRDLSPPESSSEPSPRQVELWWTGDGGRSWKLFGGDDDQQSPMLVSVEREGLYGFWLVVENDRGVRGERPRAGELPQIWVGVDTTRPTVRLISVELRPADDEQHLTVRWEASDAMLAARPVALAYSPGRDGPWQQLETAMENRGVYECQIPLRNPAQVFVHLEVRDEAGNIASVESLEPARSAAVDIPGMHARRWVAGPLYR